MADYNKIVCTGCGKTAAQCGDYHPEENPVEEDGSFADDKFVCDGCYVQLIMRGMDIGTAQELQDRAATLGRQLCKST